MNERMIHMSELICPNCGKAFTVDESDYANLLKQVRDDEFQREIEAHDELHRRATEGQVASAVAKAKEPLLQAAAAKDTKIAQLTAQLAAAQAKAKTDAELAASRAKDEASAESSRQAQTIVSLQEQLKALEARAKAEQERAVAEIRENAAREAQELRVELEQQRGLLKQSEAAHKVELTEKLQAKDALLAEVRADLELARDMKKRLSTKMLGESLEQHCETAFNQIRMTAFPNAYFEKDNDTSVNGQKGDYIFRECDESGTEIVSIMFEMKNEADDTAHTHKNEEFFKKLDSDRNAKNCEYAVLVSMLELDSDYYNAGIVDVSYRYPKMFVVRPQCFIPIITLLRNAALGSLEAKKRLAIELQRNVDVTNFETKLDKFKEGFFYNCEQAGKRFDEAIAEIDKAIKALTAVREKLTASSDQLSRAERKLDDLTVKKLTRGNATMKELFEAERERQAAEDEALESAEVEAEIVGVDDVE